MSTSEVLSTSPYVRAAQVWPLKTEKTLLQWHVQEAARYRRRPQKCVEKDPIYRVCVCVCVCECKKRDQQVPAAPTLPSPHPRRSRWDIAVPPPAAMHVDNCCAPFLFPHVRMHKCTNAQMHKCINAHTCTQFSGRAHTQASKRKQDFALIPICD